MLSLPPAIRIFVATAPTDMHLSFDRLAALARDVIHQDPFSGISSSSGTRAVTR